MAAVAGAGHALCRHTVGLRAGGGLDQLEDVPAHRLLQRGLAGDAYVGALPEAGQPLGLVIHQVAKAHRLRTVDGACAAERELLRSHVTGGVVRRELLQAHLHPLLTVQVVRHASDVLFHLRGDLHAGIHARVRLIRGVVDIQDVVHGDRHGHA